ncbi:hypothetical protein GCM10010524_18300 [Streptomyces mexicanus]
MHIAEVSTTNRRPGTPSERADRAGTHQPRQPRQSSLTVLASPPGFAGRLAFWPFA